MNQLDEIIAQNEEKKRQKRQMQFNPKRKLYKCTCVNCGTEFIANRVDAKYCCADCRVSAWNKKQAEIAKEKEEEVNTAKQFFNTLAREQLRLSIASRQLIRKVKSLDIKDKELQEKIKKVEEHLLEEDYKDIREWYEAIGITIFGVECEKTY